MIETRTTPISLGQHKPRMFVRRVTKSGLRVNGNVYDGKSWTLGTKVFVFLVSEDALIAHVFSADHTYLGEAVKIGAPTPFHRLMGPDVTMLLQSKAETFRQEYWLAYGKPCDCSTPDGALHYGRAQGLEMAADIIAAASEGSTDV